MTNAEKILRILKASDPLTISEITERLGCSRSSVQYSMRKLSESGLVRMAGAKDEGGSGEGSSFLWEVVK